MLGNLVKEIRTSKGMTQIEISESANITQSTYSKFENDQIEVRASTLDRILSKLDISMEEFKFILNGYQLSDKDRILNKFFQVPYNNIALLNEIYEECNQMLQKEENVLIRDIQTLCKSLAPLLESGEFESGRLYARQIWQRLSHNNNLYYYDIYLLNAILFVFPLDEMLGIYQYLKRGFEKYKNFQNMSRVALSTSLNIAVVLITEKLYKDALEELEITLPKCKEQKLFIPLAIGYVRKGICLNNISNNGNEWINKGLFMLEVLEEHDTYEHLKKEIELFDPNYFISQ